MKRRLVVTPFVLLATLLLGANAQKSLSGKPLTPADSLRAVIEPLFTTAQYDSILSILPGYIGRAEATRDSFLLGRALTQRGRVMLMTGHIADAERDIDTGIRIAEAARDTMGLMPALHFKGFIHTGALRYADARRCFERRVVLAQRMHSPADEAWQNVRDPAAAQRWGRRRVQRGKLRSHAHWSGRLRSVQSAAVRDHGHRQLPV
jgi:hypothetical protein